MLNSLTKRRVYVKPVAPNDESTQWLVSTENLFEAFVDDERRSSLWVAVKNLWWMLTHL